MQILHTIEIDLFEFSKNGTFDRIKTGQTREWVLNNFPNPDDFEDGESWRSGPFEIFTYGDFELHFSNDILYLIFADFDDKILSGPSLSFVNRWIFEKDPVELTLPLVIDALFRGGIDFSTSRNDLLSSITLKTKGDVELHFESDDSLDPLDYRFKAIWITDKSLL